MWNVTLGNQFTFFAAFFSKDKWPFICVQWTAIIQSQEVQKSLLSIYAFFCCNKSFLDVFESLD